MAANLGYLQESLAGKQAEFGQPEVTAEAFQDRIRVTMQLPTTVKGQNMAPSYSAEIPATLGEIADFATGLQQFQDQERFFEYYTMSAMALSPLRDGIASVPQYVAVMGCGKAYYRSWDSLRPEVETTIKSVLSNTFMPGKVPLNTIRVSSATKQPLPEINGKKYAGLDVSFHVPEGFALTRDGMSTQYLEFVGTGANTIAVTADRNTCISDPVYVRYTLRYPVVAIVKDKLTETFFKFALVAAIKDNQPDEIGATFAAEPGQCDAQLCGARLSVASANGSVTGAAVSFMGCPLGNTDRNGRFSGKAPCGIGTLEVSGNGMETFTQLKSIDDLQDATIGLQRAVNVNLLFHQVLVQDANVSDKPGYLIQANAISAIPDGRFAIVHARSAEGQELEQTYSARSGTMRLPEGLVSLSGSLGDGQRIYGSFSGQIEIKLDTSVLHLYFPVLSGSQPASAIDLVQQNAQLSALLRKCSLGPVSVARAAEQACAQPKEGLA